MYGKEELLVNSELGRLKNTPTRTRTANRFIKS